MGRVADFVTAVDAFMAAQKTLVSGGAELKWQDARDTYRRQLKIPLEIGGELSGNHLLIEAKPDAPTLTFMLGIDFQGVMVCRLDFDHGVTHGNGWATNVPPVVKGPHWHRWELNRSTFKTVENYLKLPLAEPFTQARQFDATLRHYCADRHIAVGKLDIQWPARTRLL